MGSNSSGQLGDGTKVTRSYPVRVKNTDGTGLLENIVYIAAGGSSAVAIDKDGRVYGWGSGTSNGLGSKQESLLPSPVVTSYEETVTETDDGEGNVVKETTVTKTELVGAGCSRRQRKPYVGSNGQRTSLCLGCKLIRTSRYKYNR